MEARPDDVTLPRVAVVVCVAANMCIRFVFLRLLRQGSRTLGFVAAVQRWRLVQVFGSLSCTLGVCLCILFFLQVYLPEVESSVTHSVGRCAAEENGPHRGRKMSSSRSAGVCRSR